MTEPLPDVELSPEQTTRAAILASEIDPLPYKAARLIVHLQDRVAQLERDRTFVALMGSTPDCPVTFEKGQLGACSACGKTFECGARVPSTTGPCEHDLQKPETSVIVESPWDAYCTVCKERWNLRRPTETTGDDPMRPTMFGGAPVAVVEAVMDAVVRKIDAEIMGDAE